MSEKDLMTRERRKGCVRCAENILYIKGAPHIPSCREEVRHTGLQLGGRWGQR